MTLASEAATAALADLRKALASAKPAPLEGPAFSGSHNCLANIERDYARRRAGHWFDKDTLKFFGTRFPSGFLDVPEARVTLFITTEKSDRWDAPERRATLRVYLWDSAEIETLGPFHAHTLRTAEAAQGALYYDIKEGRL